MSHVGFPTGATGGESCTPAVAGCWGVWLCSSPTSPARWAGGCCGRWRPIHKWRRRFEMDVVTNGRSCQHRFCGNKGVWQTGVSWRYFLLRFLIGVVARSSVPDRRRGGYQSGRFRFQHALGYQSGLYGYSTPLTISLASGFQRVWKVKGIVYRYLSRCGGSKNKI